ncbi:MAG: L-seryl-tRNA(Sec) selenium transferase, partial [Synergistaceae bacterium]
INSGVDIVTFSGDKLLGGPQIGAIVGSAEIVNRLRTYPLLRALRVDKMTLAAFEATLRLYLKGETEKIPTLVMVFASEKDLKKKALTFSASLKKYFKTTKLRSVSIGVVETSDAVGGGTFPQSELKGYGVSLKLPELGSTGRLAERLRMASVPIVSGASDDRLVFHMRTIRADDAKLIIAAFEEILSVPDASSSKVG